MFFTGRTNDEVFVVSLGIFKYKFKQLLTNAFPTIRSEKL